MEQQNINVDVTSLINYVYTKYKQVGDNTIDDITDFITCILKGVYERFMMEEIEKSITNKNTN